MRLLADHIHMPLQDDRADILVTLRCLLDYDDIVILVLVILKTMLFGKGNQVVTDRFLLIGGTGNLRQILKIVKHLIFS